MAPHDGRLVALKTLRTELIASTQAIAHFRKEAEFQQKLHHPHILPVLGAGVFGAIPYFTMPFMDQGSLARRIQSNGPLPRDDALKITRQISSAIAFAHKRGIIHHDLKPANILLDQNGNAFVADFGLALTVFNDPSIDPVQLRPQGTAPYWSPAVARGEAEDTRCDIYSFGALFYELLAGRPPYQGKTSDEVVARILAGPPPPIMEINPSADPALARIAEGAMARELRSRYTDAEDLGADLERVACGEAPHGPAGQAHYVSNRGHWRFRLAALGLLVVTIVAIAFSIWHGRNSGLATYRVDNPSVPPHTLVSGLEFVRTFQLLGIWRYDSAKIGDYDGDGRGDLFMVHAGQLLAISGTGQVLRQTPFFSQTAEDLILSRVGDIDRDRRDELLVRWREETNVFAAVLNQQFFELKRFRTTGSYRPVRSGGDRRYSTILEPSGIEDLNHDGRRELLARLTTGFELRPRAVVCFDFASRQELWRHEIAPVPQIIVAIDLNGDGVKEVAFGTGAVGNRHRLPDGTDDHHCYVGLLSSKGRLHWQREVGGFYCYSMPIAAELNGKPGQELLALVNATQRYQDTKPHREVGQIIQLSAEGEVLATYDAGHFLWQAQAADLDGDNRDEVLATDYLGFLHILNPDLTLRQKVPISSNPKSYVQLELTALRDLDHDGRKEIVLQSFDIEILSERNPGRDDLPPNSYVNHNSAVIILNADLKEIARYQQMAQSPRGLQLEIGPDTPTEPPELFVLGDDVKVLRLKK